MTVAAPEATTLGVAALDGHGKAEYSFYANGTADWQWADSELPEELPARARALYVGGLSLRLPPGAALLEGLMRRARRRGGALIFFDPNVRDGFGFSAAVERARVERQVMLAHVVKASKDDIDLLYPGREYPEIAASWHRMTSGVVVVTLGPEGVYATWGHDSEIRLPAAPAEVADTVGAGDAFSAALLDGLVRELPPGMDPATGLARLSVDVTHRLLERATVSAAYTCERAGAEAADARSLDEAVRRAHGRLGWTSQS
jgi:fructokinase